MRTIPSFLILTFLCFLSLAKANDFGFVHFKIETDRIPVNYHVLSPDGNFSSKRPTIVFLQGSGPKPLFQKKGNETATSIPFSRDQLKGFYFVAISKPGIPFFADANYRAPNNYHELLDFDYRVESASLVIKDLLEKQWVDDKKIAAVGFSEGAYIAPRVAILNQNVTHLACFLGGGLSQAYDPMFNLLNEEKHGRYHSEELLNEIDDYLRILQDINKESNSTTKFWRGHTYKMWSGFLKYSPIDDLVDLNIPIYFAIASKDKSSPLEGTIAVPIEFARLGKKNLTFEVCRNCDHGFNEIQTGTGKIGISKFEEFISGFFQWLNTR